MSAIAALTLLADAATAFTPARLAAGAQIIRPVAGDAPPPFELLSGAPPFRQGATGKLRLTGGTLTSSDSPPLRPAPREVPIT